MSNFAWYRFREEKEMFQRKSVGRVKKKGIWREEQGGSEEGTKITNSQDIPSIYQ